MTPLFRLPLAALALSLLSGATGHGQLPVRNAVSAGGLDPRWLADGLIETAWTSSSAGSSASLLLDDPFLVEAGYVLATGGTGPAAYQLLGSSNYRDWILLGEGSAAADINTGQILAPDPLQVNYLRLLSRSDSAFLWELLAGTESQVQDQLARLRPVDWGDITDPQVIAGMLDLAFDWQMGNLATRDEGIGWVSGAFYTGVTALHAATGGPKYRQAVIDIGTGANWKLRLRTSGKTFYHADDHCIGQAWLELYMADPAPLDVWYLDVKARLDRVMADPLPGRVDMNWCDALYMSPPNYVRLAEVTGDDSYRTFIDTQWWDVTDFLYDPAFKLFYRDSSYFDDREPNGKPVFWSRGNGWVVGGLVRMLQHMPPDWPSRGQYVVLLQDMLAALAAIQGADGLWSSSLLYPEKYDMERETSGSAFFVYAMAWGVNAGLLDPAAYGPVIERGWAGLAGMLNANGTLKFIQQVGAGPARNDGLLLTKDYGYGAFLLAGTEMMRYYAGTAPVGVRNELAQFQHPPAAFPLAGESGWTKVDDFEAAFAWTVVKTVPQSAALVQDPHDPAGSRVFSLNTGQRTAGTYRATTAIPPIANGAVATVYQRFAYDNPEIDVLFGVADVPVVSAYPDYENGLRVYFAFNQMEARAGGAYTAIGDDLLQLGTWYEAWTVINNASDTYDVHIRGGSNYPERVLLKSGLPFRNGTAASLVSYAISYNSPYCEGSFFLDDLHIDTGGENLTRPAGVRQPAYSPWSDTARRRPGMDKSTAIGTVWDESFPYVYHAQLGTWCYVWPQDLYPGGYYFWLYGTARWAWLPAAWPGWYYDYAAAAWQQMP